MPGFWYEAESGMSGMCVTDPGSATNNGTALLQSTCGTLLNQEWQFQPTGNGYLAVHNGSDPNLVWDDTNWSTEFLSWVSAGQRVYTDAAQFGLVRYTRLFDRSFAYSRNPLPSHPNR
jgi:hypothetical protein